MTQEQKVEAYCVKCKAKSFMGGVEQKTAKNGRKMLSGKCMKCSTKMNKFVGGSSDN